MEKRCRGFFRKYITNNLGNNKIFLPLLVEEAEHVFNACQVLDGGEILPQKNPFYQKRNCRRMAFRMSGQSEENMVIRYQRRFLVSKMEATVVKTECCFLIKEFVVEIPEAMDCEAGGYIQINSECEVKYKT